MKASVAILYSLLTLILVVSLTVLVILRGNNFFTPSNTPNTQPSTNAQITNTSTTASTSPIERITFNYTFSNFEKLNIGEYGENRVTLSVTINYQGKSDITIKYSQFYIKLYVYSNLGEPIQTTKTYTPQNQGSATLGPTHPTEVIQLTFQYPATIEYNKEVATTYYHLEYKANA